MRAVLLLWLLCHPALGWSQGPPPAPVKSGQQPEDQAPKKEEGTARVQQPPQQVSPSKLEPRPPANQPRPQDQPKHEDKSALPEWLVALATVGLVGVTAVLARYTFKLWEATKDLAKEAKATADRQAGEVQESLEIGRRTVQTMDDTAKRELRAYVSATRAVIHEPFSAKGGNVKVTIKNSGQTPAYDYTVTYECLNAPGPCSLDEPAKTANARGSIAPNGAILATIPLRAFSPGERAELEGGRRTLYVFGKISYTDAFQGARFTRFCFAFGGNYGSGEGDLAVAEQGNEAN